MADRSWITVFIPTPLIFRYHLPLKVLLKVSISLQLFLKSNEWSRSKRHLSLIIKDPTGSFTTRERHWLMLIRFWTSSTAITYLLLSPSLYKRTNCPFKGTLLNILNVNLCRPDSSIRTDIVRRIAVGEELRRAGRKVSPQGKHQPLISSPTPDFLKFIPLNFYQSKQATYVIRALLHPALLWDLLFFIIG